MIIEFKITNFKSYRDDNSISFEACGNDSKSQNLSVVALKDGSEVRLLNTIAILGANASGKSNIIWALGHLVYLVANSRNFDVRTKLGAYKPFAFDDYSKSLPTTFDLDFITNGIRYGYNICFNDTEFLSETLHRRNNGTDLLVFSGTRESGKGLNLKFGEGYESTSLDLDNLKALPNHLILSEIGTKEANGLQNIYESIVNIIVRPVNGIIDLDSNNVGVAELILKNESSPLFQQLARLIKIADFGIDDIAMRRHGEEEFSFPDNVPEEVRAQFIRNNRWEFRMIHGNFSLDIREESTGTKNMFAIGAYMLDALQNGRSLIIDELNLAMHPALFRFLVSLFNNKKINNNGAQLLFTTHDAYVINDNLRADQVWISEKDKSGVSQLFSVQDFENVPINSSFGDWYLAGRFGALPTFGNVDFLLDGKE